MEENQIKLFDIETEHEEEWKEMPEYNNKNLLPKYQVIINFANTEDLKEFSKLIGQPLTTKTQSVWFPEVKIGRYSDKRYRGES